MFKVNDKAPQRFKTVSTDLAFMFLLGFSDIESIAFKENWNCGI